MHAAGLELLRNSGMSDADILARGQEMRDSLKARAAKSAGGVLKVQRKADIETVKQSITDAAEMVDAKRAEQVTAASAASGKPPKPPKKPPTAKTVAEVEPPDEVDSAGLQALPYLQGDLQDSVVVGISRKMRGFQKATQVIGAATGAGYGYNVEDTDDIKKRIWNMATYGAEGMIAGHVVTGGIGTAGAIAKGLPNRAVAMYAKQLLSPRTVVVSEMLPDTVGLVIAPVMRGLSATFERGPISGIDEMFKNYGGYWAGAQHFVSTMRDALDASIPISAERHIMRAEKMTPEMLARQEVASPGEYGGSFWLRLIAGMGNGVKQMQTSGAAWANAAAAEKYVNKFAKTMKDGDAIKALKQEFEADKTGDFIAEMEGEFPDVAEKIRSGLWNDFEVLHVAQDRYLNGKMAEYVATLPKPADVGAEWTLMNDIGSGLKAGSKGQGGATARIINNVTKGIQEVPLLNPTIGGVEIPFGRMLAPFRTAIANGSDQFINLLPVIGAVNQGAYPEIRRSTILAKQVLGSALITGTLALIGDSATDSGPDNRQDYFKWLDTENKPPDSFRWIDGKWRPIKDLPPPMQLPYRVAGALNGYKRDKIYGKSVPEQTMWVMKEFLETATDITPWQSLMGIAHAIQSNASDPFDALTKEVGFQIGGLAGSTLAVPAAASRTTAPDYSVDPLMGPLRARLPGTTNQIPGALDRTAQVKPNPQEGWRALLGNYAGKEQANDKDLAIYLDQKIGTGLSRLNATTYGSGDTALPMDPNMLRAVKVGTAVILKASTKKNMDSAVYKALPTDEKRKAFLGRMESIAHDDAFWKVVNTMGRDKYMATLPDDATRSQFRSSELAYQMAKQGRDARYASADGKPLNKEQWGDYDKLLKQYAGQSNKPNVVAQVQGLKDYAAAAQAQKMMASPNLPDYVQHSVQHWNDDQWKQFMAGQNPIYGVPGAIDPAKQLQFVAQERWYDALPSTDPRKKNLKQSMDLLKKVKIKPPTAAKPEVQEAA